MADESKTSWLTSAAPIIGSVLDTISGIGSGLFNMNQAKKNRAFQERMYQRQLNDNIMLWKMNNEYNLPSAVRQRLEDANLNPLLMYEGGTSLTSSSVAQGANAPSGDSARANIQSNFANTAMQSALMRSQIANIDADTEQKKAAAGQSNASAENIAYDTLFRKLCQNVEIDLKHANLNHLNQSVQNLSMQTLALSETTFQSILTMRQAREYEIKRFNLDYNTIGTQLEQGWKSIANDTERVNQGWKELSLKWLELQNNIRWTNEQIGALRWNVIKDKAMFGPQFEGLKLDNKLKIWDRKLKESQFNANQITTFNQLVEGYFLRNTGTRSPGPVLIDTMWKPVKPPTLQDLLVIPKVK